MGISKRSAPSMYPREFIVASEVFIALGGLWFLGFGALAFQYLGDPPIGRQDTNVIMPGLRQSLAFGVLALALAVPAVPVLAIGIALRAGARVAAPLALVATGLVFVTATYDVAFLAGPLQPGGLVRWPLALAALALLGAVGLLLVPGFASPTTTIPAPRGPLFRRALVRSRLHTGLLFGGALAVVVIGQTLRARALASSSFDFGPLGARSDLTLALQATSSPQLTAESARAELQARGPRAVPAIVRAVGACPMTLLALRRNPRSMRVDEICTATGVPAFLDLLGPLGGPDAITELRRWARSAEADPVLRDHAGAALAQTNAPDSVADIAALLDVPDPPTSPHEILRRRDLLAKALVQLHASDQAQHLAAVLRQLGPQTQGVDDAMHALGDFGTDAGWAAYPDLARSPDPAWRREALRPYNRAETLPSQVTALCLDELDDDDKDVRLTACQNLMGPTYDLSHKRYPGLFALTQSPCWPLQADLVRDAVAGRPLPEPPNRRGLVGPLMHRPVPGRTRPTMP